MFIRAALHMATFLIAAIMLVLMTSATADDVSLRTSRNVCATACRQPNAVTVLLCRCRDDHGLATDAHDDDVSHHDDDDNVNVPASDAMLLRLLAAGVYNSAVDRPHETAAAAAVSKRQDFDYGLDLPWYDDYKQLQSQAASRHRPISDQKGVLRYGRR